MGENNPIQVADRIFLVIETLAFTGPMGLLELSKHLELNKSTVHRLLSSLIYMGYVKQDLDTGKYSLSFKIWEIANQVLTKIDIVDIAKPHLKKLVEKTGETVHLVQIDGTKAVYIDKVESYNNSVRMVSKVGKSIPLYCSAVGKALLAEMDDNAVKKMWDNSEIEKLTNHTIVDFTAFKKHLSTIYNNGFSLDDEENELGVRCIAVCLKDYRGKAKYAISLSAPVNRMNNKRIKELSKYILETKTQLMEEWK
jgi:DNA-binding IclR family transcriptional regulator